MPTNRRRPSGLSTSTDDLLTKMMKESGITASQQRRLRASLAQGAPLPSRCHPTSSDPGKPQVSRTTVSGTRLVTSAGRVNPRLYTGGKRAKKDIVQVQRPQFQSSGHVVDRDRVKAQYADRLSFGIEGAARREQLREQARQGTLKPTLGSRRQGVNAVEDLDIDAAGGHSNSSEHKPTYKDGQQEFNEIMAEIDERKEHLDVMRRMGANAQSIESRLQREIAMRVRRLEDVDRQQKERLQELEQLDQCGAGATAVA